MIKVGFLTPLLYAEKVRVVASSEFSNIQITELVFNNYRDVEEIVNKAQNRFDALLFSGEIVYSYAKSCEQNILWDVIPRHTSALFCALLRAQIQGYDIKNISINSFSKDVINEVYHELGISQKDTKIFVMDNSTYEYEDDYIDRVIEFHKANIKNVSCAMTDLYFVHQRLTSENLPCVPILLTNSIILDALSRLQLKLATLDVETRQLVVLFVKIKNPNEYSVIAKNVYQHALDKMKIGEQVFRFAEKIQAAVVESPNSDGYLLFSTKSILELETNNYQKIELIESMANYIPHSISIGIGYGKTANIAMYNAILGASKAEKCDYSAAYVIPDNGRVLGPIEVCSHRVTEEKIDGYLLSVSEKSGVSINRIYDLYDIKNKDKKDCFTSKELSEQLKISVRAIDNMLYKLEGSGYAKVIGRKIIEKKGRPSRITRITF